MKTIVPQSEILPACYLAEVQAYATNGFTVEHIANLVGMNNIERQLFFERVTCPGDDFYRAYQTGFTAGQHTIRMALKEKADKGDTEAIKLFAESINDEQALTLRQTHFGV
jgi:hypothetical protein